MFVGKRPDGSIYGCWTCPQPNDVDHPGIIEVPDNDSTLVAFQTSVQTIPIDKIADLQTQINALKSQMVTVGTVTA
jgi:hypothetical protein